MLYYLHPRLFQDNSNFIVRALALKLWSLVPLCEIQKTRRVEVENRFFCTHEYSHNYSDYSLKLNRL